MPSKQKTICKRKFWKRLGYLFIPSTHPESKNQFWKNLPRKENHSPRAKCIPQLKNTYIEIKLCSCIGNTAAASKLHNTMLINSNEEVASKGCHYRTLVNVYKEKDSGKEATLAQLRWTTDHKRKAATTSQCKPSKTVTVHSWKDFQAGLWSGNSNFRLWLCLFLQVSKRFGSSSSSNI